MGCHLVHFRQVMGGEKYGGPSLSKVHQDLSHLNNGGGVQPIKGLVQHQELWFVQYGHGKEELLFHAQGVFLDLLGYEIFDPHSIYSFSDGLFAKFASFTDKFQDRKSTRLNSSHVRISYAVFCL